MVVLALLDWFPPTSLLVRPLLSAVFKAAGDLVLIAWRYVMILSRTVVDDHVTVFMHLTRRRVSIDPREKMEADNEGK